MLQLKQNEQTFVQEYEGRFAKKLMDGIGPIYMVSGTRDILGELTFHLFLWEFQRTVYMRITK